MASARGAAWMEREGALPDGLVIAGVDEAGRGPLAGPVVAAAVVLGEGFLPAGINDSKQLSPRRRQELAREIVAGCRGWGIGVVGAERIDATDIRRASLEAMARGYAQLLAQGLTPDLVLVDGRDCFELPQRSPAVKLRAVVGGDRRSANVAAASILAKVWRDALMLEYHAEWPQYGFDRHKGYPTRAHKQALARYGPCPIHRLSFRGVGRPRGA